MSDALSKADRLFLEQVALELESQTEGTPDVEAAARRVLERQRAFAARATAPGPFRDALVKALAKSIREAAKAGGA